MAQGVKLVPKRKLTFIGDPNEIENLVQHTLESIYPSLTREMHVNDDRPVLTLDQAGSGISLQLDHATQPELRFTEKDQTDPTGRYRIRGDGGLFYLDRALTADWATSTPILYAATTTQLSNYDEDGYTRIYGGTRASVSANIIAYGKDNANAGQIIFITPNAAKNAGVTRLTMGGAVGAATATWNAILHSGFVANDINLPSQGELTISGGVVTATGAFHLIDTQSDDATDDLDTINGGSNGDVLIIRAAHTDRTVVIKHGTGNIYLSGGVDVVFDNTEKALILFFVTNAWMDLRGGDVGALVAVTSKTGAYTATTTDHLILCDASGGAFTITLPASASNTGRVYRIKKTDSSANALTVDGNASETIDGATTASITTQYESITIVCDGSNWHIT